MASTVGGRKTRRSRAAYPAEEASAADRQLDCGILIVPAILMLLYFDCLGKVLAALNVAAVLAVGLEILKAVLHRRPPPTDEEW